MENRQLSVGTFIIAVAALAVSYVLAFHSLVLAPREIYTPPVVSAGIPAAVSCDESDVPAPENLPGGYEWHIHSQACFGFALPDTMYVNDSEQFVLYNGAILNDEDYRDTHSMALMKGNAVLLLISIGTGESDLTPADAGVDHSQQTFNDNGGKLSFYGPVDIADCGFHETACQQVGAEIDFADSGMIHVDALSFQYPVYDYTQDIETTGPSGEELVTIVQTIAELARFH